MEVKSGIIGLSAVSLNEDALLAEKLAQMEKENAEKEEKMAFEKLQVRVGIIL